MVVWLLFGGEGAAVGCLVLVFLLFLLVVYTERLLLVYVPRNAVVAAGETRFISAPWGVHVSVLYVLVLCLTYVCLGSKISKYRGLQRFFLPIRRKIYIY